MGSHAGSVRNTRVFVGVFSREELTKKWALAGLSRSITGIVRSFSRFGLLKCVLPDLPAQPAGPHCVSHNTLLSTVCFIYLYKELSKSSQTS